MLSVRAPLVGVRADSKLVPLALPCSPVARVLLTLESTTALDLPRTSLVRGRGLRSPFPVPPNLGLEEKGREERVDTRGTGTLLSPVGGCLSARWSSWQAASAEPWVVDVIRLGYRIPFQEAKPPLACTSIPFRTYRPGSSRWTALGQEVSKMLDKGALEIVDDHSPGFYSRLFLVEKATGGWRPVIDLSPLNKFVLQTKFKMETVASVMASIREGDFLASIDLKDAYFQIPIHQDSRKYLRFVVGGVVYQFKVLCFGLSTAPQVFTRVFAPISAWAHSHGIRLLRYLDDWLILASSEEKLRQDVQKLLSFCHELGIVINEEKSDLVPSQRAKYLGMVIDTRVSRIYPTDARIAKFQQVTAEFLTGLDPPARSWQVVLGHMASLEKLVPHGRIRMRSLQWRLKEFWSPELDRPSQSVPLCWGGRSIYHGVGQDELQYGSSSKIPNPDMLLFPNALKVFGEHTYGPIFVFMVWSED